MVSFDTELMFKCWGRNAVSKLAVGDLNFTACLVILKLVERKCGGSTNGGTPKSSILVDFSIINHLFYSILGYPH